MPGQYLRSLAPRRRAFVQVQSMCLFSVVMRFVRFPGIGLIRQFFLLISRKRTVAQPTQIHTKKICARIALT